MKRCVELVSTDWKQLCTHTVGWETQRLSLICLSLDVRLFMPNNELTEVVVYVAR